MTDLGRLEDQQAMLVLAEFIDHASDTSNSEQAKLALKLCDELAKRVQGTLKVELYYFRANAWSVIRHVKHKDESTIWLWDQDELLQEVYWLRSAIRSDDFGDLSEVRQCQILVNTGNILSHIGRLIEAIEYWQRALNILPNFGMAMVNLGLGYETYAKMLYDQGHAVVIFKEAYDVLTGISNQRILWEDNEFEIIKKQMLGRASQIAEHVDFSALDNISLDGFSLGKSKVEQNYRQWTLDNSLYINPLNEIGTFSIAAQDVMHLPSMITNIDEPPYLFGFYNQLKQEYVSARYLLWEGITESEKYNKHFSDNDVYLLNTLDSTAYGLAIEQIKIAFRSTYSLFDKIAYFVNDYWGLKIPEAKKINFQSVWVDTHKGVKQLRSEFMKYPNLSLRGLYWISKDFIEQDNSNELVLGKTMEPEADKLRTIRNHLEHKYLKVHDNMWGYTDEKWGSFFSDQLAYHISHEELSQKTIRLIKMARAALMYLSMAVHQREKMKAKEMSGISIPFDLPKWE
ncbi:LA2681 family HEPN domain-containing protein [Methylophaga nitratireducenticrescens]|nr:LA2681 family HEPN domain-containing protein [Methylophaga nitratireducenticrescens]